MKKILFMLGLSLIVQLAIAQSFTEKITKELIFEKKSIDNALMIANINGSIKVVGYAGDKILLTVEKTIKAKTQERLEKGKMEIQLGILDRADTLILYSNSPCHQFDRKTNYKNHSNGNKRGWGYNWSDQDGRNCQENYDYTLNFTLQVPASVHLRLSTINNGDISVENMKGSVSADNINGSIKLNNLVRESYASTINGDVDITYTQNPDKDCRFYTLNGDINAYFQKNLAASLSFESFNGEFYTNIDQIERLPALVEEKKGKEGIKYKVKGNRYKVGKGGALLDFETFNGNVYLKEN
ncbi:MAG TPA: hypothetical protein PLJ60_02185 [Chryseolinea sp.]|nr:hypothetical protein [Chryseolinea sp.]HPH46223.1 hypothetical protein [Chryseolinea sp.]HPM29119.1 hypothetical protein [Chryseolinea sp.]